MSGSSVLSVENMSVTYPGDVHPSVSEISFELKQGSISVLIGPNGSGKSTVIKAVLGLLESSGEILFDKAVSHHAVPSIGYVPQRYPVDKSVPITVFEFLSLALVICNHSSAEKQAMIREVLKKVDLESKIFEKVADLSGGQLQRVLLARALVHQPQLLFLDEPEAGVDVGGEQLFYGLLKRLAGDEGVTILLASHEISLLGSFADQVICVNKQVVCAGRPESVLKAETFKKLYGDAVMYYGHNGHQHSHNHHNAHNQERT